ncbi:MAG: DNA repair protein RecO [bacterium]|nr:DNA repair protein RecO [bacterium]
MTYNTHGIILKYRDIGEFDRIYSILTYDHGKIEGWAQGVRKPKSKLVSYLQPIYLCDFMFARGRRFDRIAQVKVLNRFGEIWNNLGKIGEAAYAVSLVDLVLRPGTKEHAVFELVQQALTVISNNGNVAATFRSPHGSLKAASTPFAQDNKAGGDGILTLFSLKLLKQSGFAPELYNCVVCKRPVQGLSKPFDAVRGGVLCDDCYMTSSEYAFPVSAITLETLEMILTSPLAPIEMPEVIGKELTQIARAMITAHFGEEPKARYFIDAIERKSPQSLYAEAAV